MGRMTGLGSGIVLLWIYNQIAAHYGLEQMPAEVAAAIAGALIDWTGLRADRLAKASGEETPTT